MDKETLWTPQESVVPVDQEDSRNIQIAREAWAPDQVTNARISKALSEQERQSVLDVSFSASETARLLGDDRQAGLNDSSTLSKDSADTEAVFNSEQERDDSSPSGDKVTKSTSADTENATKVFRKETDKLVSTIARAHGVKKLEGLVGVNSETNTEGYTATRVITDTDGREIRVTATHKADTIVAQRGSDVYVLNLQDPSFNLKFKRGERDDLDVTGSTAPGREKEMRRHIQQAVSALIEQGEKQLKFRRKGEAEKDIHAAIVIAEGALKGRTAGTNERLLADTLGAIGRAHREHGDGNVASKFMEQAVKLYEKIPDLQESMSERRALAYLYHSLNKTDRAVEHADRVAQILKDYERDHGANDLTAVEERKHLSSLFSKLGKLDEAEELLGRSVNNLEEQERTLGKGHPDVIRERDRLAIYYSKLWFASGPINYRHHLKDTSKSLLDRSSEVMIDRVEKHGVNDSEALQMKRMLHHLYGEALGKGGPAIEPQKLLDRPFLERTLPEKEKRLGEGHKETMNDRQELAEVYHFAGKAEESAALLNKSIAIITKQPDKGPDHPDVLSLLKNLVWVYKRAEDLPKAKKTLERLIKLQEKTGDEETEFYKGALKRVEGELKDKKMNEAEDAR